MCKKLVAAFRQPCRASLPDQHTKHLLGVLTRSETGHIRPHILASATLFTCQRAELTHMASTVWYPISGFCQAHLFCPPESVFWLTPISQNRPQATFSLGPASLRSCSCEPPRRDSHTDGPRKDSRPSQGGSRLQAICGVSDRTRLRSSLLSRPRASPASWLGLLPCRER